MSEIAIFYADDDEDDLMFFNDAVDKISSNSEESIKLYMHRNGESLLENIEKNKIENGVVFLDINMPRKSGFQLLEEIRSTSKISRVPVIIYSTSYNELNVKMSHNLGANFYVVKPHNFNDLVVMINNVIKINWEKKKADFENFIYFKR